LYVLKHIIVMELILNRIKLISEQNKLSIRKLCSELGITEVGFAKMFKNDSLKVATLDKIAKYFNVPVSYFFEEGEVKVGTVIQNGTNGIMINNGNVQHFSNMKEAEKEVEYLKKENEHLRALVESKQETIDALKGK